MKDLHPQFELLIRYADGVADEAMQKRAIELINTDTEAAEFFKSLQATTLDYKGIYAEQLAVPQHLINEVAAAQPSEEHQSSIEQPAKDSIASSVSARQSDKTVAGHRQTVSPVTDRQAGGYGKLALAASLAIGLIGGAVFYGVAMTTTPDYETESVADVAMVPEWVRLVADYHRLYVRETVTATAVSSAEMVSQQVSETLQTEFRVPALEQQGMEFRRAQWLAIDGQPLLQLAYLPDSGKPLAVCLLKKNNVQDTAAQYGETGGMQYVHWQTGEHAVVIVGTVGQDLLREINGIVKQQIL